ncbi:urea transporter [Pholiota conissans]|uniref:Urea transporter n=1 Tax=Pholiota conissans TaxID=109636 RepID=A0A9P5ZE33_9AGAR|nr:urea transporter [Pholiota conissans]
MSSAAPLPQGAGYAVVLGLGFAFALFMNGITWIQQKFSHLSLNSASEFSAASRSLKTGLVVAGIISSWTWSLTLLQSATQSYNMGVSGGYWYAIGGTLQIAIFSVIASKVKINANRATTFPEVAYIRFGTAGHLSFLWCGIVCNAIVSACILIGAGSVVTALTGMNQYASLFLIPVGVAIYVATGGLRATFICDATHTFALLLILLGFGFVVFTGSNVVGSPTKLHELLVKAAETWPVEGNYHGSYLTFRSRPGAIFAVQSIITGFGLVTCDQGYWSRAIASNPSSTARAYFLGGIGWFSIPLACGTALGLTARGLSTLPDFPELSAFEVGAGLAAVRTVTYLMGTAGSVLMLLLIFLSVTSALSAELIATSTLLSYDVYRHYFNPKATSHQVVTASRYFIAFWAVFSAALASIFYAVGINLGWLFYFLGVSTASGVFPIALTFLWKDLSTAGAVAGSIGGMAIALIVWLVTAKTHVGSITVDSLSDQWVSFAGNTAAIISGGILSIGLSLWRPANFDWEKTRSMAVVEEDLSPSSSESASVSSSSPNQEEKVNETSNEKNSVVDVEVAPALEDSVAVDGLDIPALNRTFKKYTFVFAIMAIIITLVIPAPLGGAPYVFSPKFFTAFVVVMFIWLFFAFFLVVILPVYESRHALLRISRAIFGIWRSKWVKIPQLFSVSA